MGTQEARATARQVLDFWFDALTPEQHFKKDALLDDEIGRRFGALRDTLFATDAAGWDDTAEHTLSAIIVLDQLSRNLFRDQAEAFAADPLALDLCLAAIARGFHAELDARHRAFLYLPLMHCENLGVQLFSVRCYSEPGLEFNLNFARSHADVIERFGRFPSRNAALGRISTPQEKDYLAQPGSGW
ncbi:MAG: DUF924 domain-containing protein [Sphingobium sp.]|nr:DUF924 domain-containing protein [Sphingobium sp.]MBP8670725.1 DUF924 domain-containing protein [Sphingobium sp.]MBP9156546.1 DUF924 domain-containing protein [Sphingobium sp.]MCC6482765.1 DUF924 domain-containing protein [Sphingomonadaceae bacterium]